jgi:type IV pilus assembly protein PilC
MALKLHLSRFCMSAELLIQSHTPLQQTLSLVSKMITFYPLQQAVIQMEKDIIGGMPLHKSMARFPVFESKMVSLIRVGEEVNKLAPMLSKIKKMYDDEIDHRSAIIGTVMEPLIIIVIGLVVGLVLVSMYLPMFKMSTTMAQ